MRLFWIKFQCNFRFHVESNVAYCPATILSAAVLVAHYIAVHMHVPVVPYRKCIIVNIVNGLLMRLALIDWPQTPWHPRVMGRLRTQPWLYRVCVLPGVGVTKAPFANFSVSKIFDLAKVPLKLFESHLYLTGATAAELRRHLPNINHPWCTAPSCGGTSAVAAVIIPFLMHIACRSFLCLPMPCSHPLATGHRRLRELSWGGGY